jgi:hypothetical protein
VLHPLIDVWAVGGPESHAENRNNELRLGNGMRERGRGENSETVGTEAIRKKSRKAKLGDE